MIPNLNGKWDFNEDFGFGKDHGFAVISQQGTDFEGFIEFEEALENEVPFRVKEEIRGKIVNGQVGFYGISFQILESEQEIDYRLDQWEGVMNKNGQIVGHSVDDDGTCGVFVMNRIENNE